MLGTDALWAMPRRTKLSSFQSRMAEAGVWQLDPVCGRKHSDFRTGRKSLKNCETMLSVHEGVRKKLRKRTCLSSFVSKIMAVFGMSRF